jgi:hypothetical protein
MSLVSAGSISLDSKKEKKDVASRKRVGESLEPKKQQKAQVRTR